jgi:hypothetical protein
MDWLVVALDRVQVREHLDVIMEFGSIKCGESID